MKQQYRAPCCIYHPCFQPAGSAPASSLVSSLGYGKYSRSHDSSIMQGFPPNIYLYRYPWYSIGILVLLVWELVLIVKMRTSRISVNFSKYAVRAQHIRCMKNRVQWYRLHRTYSTAKLFSPPKGLLVRLFAPSDKYTDIFYRHWYKKYIYIICRLERKMLAACLERILMVAAGCAALATTGAGLLRTFQSEIRRCECD